MAPPDWHPRHFASAPHRLAFAAAGLVLVAASAWWLVVLAAGTGARAAHVPLMTFGFMPLFFAGFLFTAGPKWLQRPPVAARVLAWPIASHATGWAIVVAAAGAADPAGSELRACGLAAMAAGWSLIVVRFVRLLRSSGVPDRAHARQIAAAMVFGALSMWTTAIAAAMAREDVVRAASVAALWGFVGVVFVTAAHRLVPFVSDAAVPALDARHPRWLLTALTTLLAVEAAAGAVDALGLPVGAHAWAARAALETFAGLALAALALRWARLPGARLRMTAALRVGWLWFAAGWGMLAGAHAARAIGTPAPAWEHAALHAYTMGFLGATMFAMVSRVSATQQGRSVGIDGVAWALFWLLQVAVVLRVGYALGPHRPHAPWLLVASAAVWGLVMTAWTARHVYWFGQPPRGRLPPARLSRARASRSRAADRRRRSRAAARRRPLRVPHVRARAGCSAR